MLLPIQESLTTSAKSALLLGGGFTIVRDVAQFGAMLVMVRLLAPEDYGSAALAQSFLGLLSVASFGTFVSHALQFRDPARVDWQAHFTAACVLNTGIFLLTLLLAWALSLTQRYDRAALPLAALAITFLVEIPGSLRHRMLETQHDWVRFQLLLILGTALGLGTGLVIALCGGGVWALVVQPPLFGLPAAIDLFRNDKWRPDWTWSWTRYRDTVRFGMNRMGAAAAIRGRQTVEQTVMAGAYDFAALGVFTRTIGLATLIAGRLGPVVLQTLYPVVTRAEAGSERFQRVAGLVLQGVCWITIPAAIFVSVHSQDTVALIYGKQWQAVVEILPLAIIGVGLGGIAATLSSLLLANNAARLCLMIDIAGAIIGLALALWLIPSGIKLYLAALAVNAFIIVLISLIALVTTRGISLSSLSQSIFPALLSSALATLSITALDYAYSDTLSSAARLLIHSLIFGCVYLCALRISSPSATLELLKAAPVASRLRRLIFPHAGGE